MHPPLPDAGARERIRSSLAETLVVEAAAGTGKTSELVARVVSLVTTGTARLSNVVAVTFTQKAAGEMKLRLLAELERVRGRIEPDTERAARVVVAITELETAHIGTIQELCARLLRERPIEALVDPRFEVASGDESDALFNEAFDKWFSTEQANPPEGVRRFLRRRARGFNTSEPSERLRSAARSLVEHRDFQGRWRRPDFERIDTMTALVNEAQALGALASRAQRRDDWLAKSLAEIKRWTNEQARLEADSPRDDDGLEAHLRDLSRHRSWRWKGTGRWYGKNLPRARVLEQRDAFKTSLDAFIAASDADIAACLYEELAPVAAAYDRLKARAGKLDSLDLLMKLRNLVRDNASVRREFQARFSHLLVDEFQDTDPLQAELLVLLAADDPDERDWLQARVMAGKLFVVGDPKQAIYRFRRSDIALYQAIKKRLVQGGATTLVLNASFRAAPELQHAINAAFAGAMSPTKDGAQADYVPLEPVRPETKTQPAVIALPIPAPFSDWGQVTNQAVNASLPDAVGGFVHWLVNESGWTVTAPDDRLKRVPVRARHVCLLFKRFQSFRDDATRPYLHALESRRVPHVLVGGRSWHKREEVHALRTALAAIEWPEDELSVFATLRGPFFSLSDESLLAFRATFESPHPLRPINEEALTPLTRPVFDALGVLALLHRHRNKQPTADTVSMLLELTRAHAGIAIWHAGEQALGNLLKVVDEARRFEAGGAASFRAFVERLDAEAERGDVGEAPVVGENTDAVRVMTVHHAKGLEFPVVILCDPLAPQKPSNPSHWVDAPNRLWLTPLAGCVPAQLEAHRQEALLRDEEEAVRLAYVAATRARDLLVVPTIGEDHLDGWLTPLQDAVYPRADSRAAPTSAPGCPAFGTDSIATRPHQRSPGATSIRPGQHVPMTGQHRVTWWDPHQLELGTPSHFGLRHPAFVQVDDASVAESGWDGWRRKREATLAAGKRPSMHLVKAAAAVLTEDNARVLHESTETSKQPRPRGKQFATLVREVLAEVEFNASRDLIDAAVRAHARPLGIHPEELSVAMEAIEGALAHPLLARAAQSTDRRRGSPLLIRTDHDTLVEAVVGLAWREGNEWFVLDFKTERYPENRDAADEREVGLYAAGIREATGLVTTAILLSV